MCAYATPPGGIVATFIDSFEEPTFLALRPTLYWMLFHARQFPPPRITRIPFPPSTNRERSKSASRESAGIGVWSHIFEARLAQAGDDDRAGLPIGYLSRSGRF